MKNKHFRFLFLLPLMALLTFSCKDPEPSPELPPAEPSFSIAPVSIDFTGDAEQKKIVIMASEGVKWVASASSGNYTAPEQYASMERAQANSHLEQTKRVQQRLGADANLAALGLANEPIALKANTTKTAILSWLSLDKNSGEGNGEITVSVSPNNSGAVRTATVTIVAEGVGTLNVSITQVKQADPVVEITFADPKFKEALLKVTEGDIYDPLYTGHIPQRIDENEDGIISEAEAAKVIQIYVNDSDISNLKELSYFPELMYFGAFNNPKLTQIDISGNEKLLGINVSECNLEALDVTNNTELQTIKCWENKIESLDLSQNHNLVEIICWDNQLIELDFSNNKVIERIYVGDNKLKKLDLSNTKMLNDMSFAENLLEEVDLSDCVALESWLFAQGNKLTDLDISKCTKLAEIYCGLQTDADDQSIENRLRCSTIQKIDLLPYISDSRNEGVTFVLTDQDGGNSESVNLTLTEMPEDGSSITQDTWIISSDTNPISEDFTKLYNALQSAGRMVRVEFTDVEMFPDDALFKDINKAIYYLSSVKAPSATEVGDNAFRNCPGIATIEMSMLEKIGDGAFMRARLLESIEFPKLSEIGDEAFGYCDLLYSIDLPEVISIGEKAFQYASSLMEVKMPLLKTTGANAFLYCESLLTISLPKVVTLGMRTFYQCYELTTVSLPMAENYGSYLFYSCDDLKKLTLGTEANSISTDAGAFDGPTLSEIALITGADNGTTIDPVGRTWTIGLTKYGPFASIEAI